MSTIGNTSPHFRQRSDTPSSPRSSNSNPKPRKIITSKQSNAVLPKPPRRIAIPERRNRSFFSQFTTESIFSPWYGPIIRNGLLVFSLSVILSSILCSLPWDSSPLEARAPLRPKGPDHHVKEITVRDLESPFVHLLHYSTIHYLDGLRDAYADTRYTLDSLRRGILYSAIDPDINWGLYNFRERVYSFSYTIWKYRERVAQLAEDSTERCETVKTALGKEQSYYFDSPWTQEIPRLWLTLFEGLKQDVQVVLEETYEFQDEFAKVCQDRRHFQFQLKEAEREMNKTNEKQGDANFNFTKAYQLLEQIGGDPEGYEQQLLTLTKDTYTKLSTCNSYLTRIIQKLQNNYMREIEAPTHDEQIRIIDRGIEVLTSQIE
ncbi:hypothetical protein DSL72_001650 [Monilinia vaccinii-corymbosi]|uniref:Uncharacterized protein n=1 Tax=Monilinia vaccinii-corymbosi TaxID=61207 RepID=A0A8A3P807_9HELO|nr:hypothetical protein DSL72_001650 [Monilinia vaccinii-corymbosi]